MFLLGFFFHEDKAKGPRERLNNERREREGGRVKRGAQTQTKGPPSKILVRARSGEDEKRGWGGLRTRRPIIDRLRSLIFFMFCSDKWDAEEATKLKGKCSEGDVVCGQQSAFECPAFVYLQDVVCGQYDKWTEEEEEDEVLLRQANKDVTNDSLRTRLQTTATTACSAKL